MKFRLILREDLARDLDQNSLLDTTLSTDEQTRRKALQLGLVEAAAIITIVVGAHQVVRIWADLADLILNWRREHNQLKVKVIVEGARDSKVIEVDATWDSTQLADTIRVTIEAE